MKEGTKMTGAFENNKSARIGGVIVLLMRVQETPTKILLDVQATGKNMEPMDCMLSLKKC